MLSFGQKLLTSNFKEERDILLRKIGAFRQERASSQAVKQELHASHKFALVTVVLGFTLVVLVMLVVIT